MAFVIRFDDPQRNPMWLRSEHPAVKWGPLADARRYRTKAAAVSAATKLMEWSGRAPARPASKLARAPNQGARHV
jgi:hypothetical protein